MMVYTKNKFGEQDIAIIEKPNFELDDVSDGVHTFRDLYFQRMMLFVTLVNLFPHISWKTKRHEDGELCFGGGWFLVTIETPAGPYGYHYKEEYYDLFNCKELDRAPEWDGYTEKNVDRLFSLFQEKRHDINVNSYTKGFVDGTRSCELLYDHINNKLKEE